MTIIEILWFLIWGGMFTGPYNLTLRVLSGGPFAMFQGLRALFPVLAAYIVLLWMLTRRPAFPFARTPLRYFLLYILTGLVSTLFLSPQKTVAMYWLSVYVAPFLLMWMISDRDDAARRLERLMTVNYATMAALTLLAFPALRTTQFDVQARQQVFMMPLGLGEVRANGIGRYAVVVVIVALVRFTISRSRFRLLWLAPMIPSLYLLMRAQSRTALLGIAVASVLFMVVRGFDWRLLFVGPAFAYVLWVAGVEWRSGGRFAQLVNLTGRQTTWQKGMAQLGSSPFLGWGFNADRILLNAEHMHNSYLHAALHSGLIGALFFSLGIASLWWLLVRGGILARVRSDARAGRGFAMESVLILGFLTARSFFESTGAFFGVDLLLMIPAITYLFARERDAVPDEAEAFVPGEPPLPAGSRP